MSKEQLTKIKNARYFFHDDPDSDLYKDWQWLIERAKRVQELENENRILRTVAESNKYIGEQYLEQNKRYREALEEVLKTGDYEDPQDYIDRIVTKACQALEGDLE
mgnify:CR=1 FL=1